MEKIVFSITNLDANQRIDKYLMKQLANAPQSFIFRLFRLKDVRVNEVKVAQNYIVNMGDEVTIFLTPAQRNDFIVPYQFNQSTLSSPIIYENDDVLVVNKIRGLLVHCDINEQTNTLTNQVLTYLASTNQFDVSKRGYIPSPVGRIDKNTSGIVVFAKTQAVNQALSQALHDNQVTRKYLALVHGKVDHKGKINFALTKSEDNRGLVSVDEDGKEAITLYKKLKEYRDFSFVEIQLETGRSNQIRVHFAHIGHPIVGDHKYGIADNYSTLCLHHCKLRFTHLDDRLKYINEVEFVAPVPSDMNKILMEIED